ncbi:hypothetical protein [Paractinoplanes atraurantiacus]|uniref:Uncharacterized conserved protein n=1 Tax=Paractinoplanes atraurantiacus TaxID=1036182 RepID=A0A285HJL7_9ACTN|nr:hypothetical protein [Actinoplanes atraurantiacus]SNY34966.1 Uncharacterized conserved protein [Actinoplanes atraurantiacus]
MTAEVWILGGTGRSARAIATELLRRGIAPTLIGRDATRLSAAAATIGGRVHTVVARSLEEAADEIRRRRPAVVINTVGPFGATAEPIIRACLPASHYVDLANDVGAVSAVLNLHEAAVSAGRSLVTGAGFGVTATESVVVKLCADRPAPSDVRVDMVPSLAIEAGRLGEALAATILEGLPGVEGGGRFEGRRYRDGRLAPARLAGDALTLTLPDGSSVTTAGMPLGELVAAQRASGAPSVIAASSEAPTAPIARAFLPFAASLLSIAALRSFAVRRLAAVQVKARPRPREHSWGHARITWPDGTVREGWLRLGDAQDFTGAVPAEVARRLLAGEGRPGASFPAALFGPSLAESCGADYVLAGLPSA